MPYVKIQTNVDIPADKQQSLLAGISQLTAAKLDKPESYVMVALDPTTPMLFAGSSDPLCYLEVKSIGLPESKTAELSAVLADIIGDKLGIAKDRVYIEFVDAPRAMWGWNGGTF